MICGTQIIYTYTMKRKNNATGRKSNSYAPSMLRKQGKCFATDFANAVIRDVGRKYNKKPTW